MNTDTPEALLVLATRDGPDTLKYLVAALYAHDGTDTRETVSMADLVAKTKALQ